jgi:hypothetical protein
MPQQHVLQLMIVKSCSHFREGTIWHPLSKGLNMKVYPVHFDQHPKVPEICQSIPIGMALGLGGTYIVHGRL